MRMLTENISVFEIPEIDLFLKYAQSVEYKANKSINVLSFVLDKKINNDNNIDYIKDKFLNYTNPCYEKYFNVMNIFNYQHCGNVALRKYIIGNNFTPHIDCEDGEPIIYVGILFLNNDFTGGKLFFDDINLTYEPKAGEFIIFPCYVTHSVSEIISGNRYIAFRSMTTDI